LRTKGIVKQKVISPKKNSETASLDSDPRNCGKKIINQQETSENRRSGDDEGRDEGCKPFYKFLLKSCVASCKF
jgi:hypothetical protein